MKRESEANNVVETAFFFFSVNGEERNGDVVCGVLLYVCLLFCFGTPRACSYASGIFHWKQASGDAG